MRVSVLMEVGEDSPGVSEAIRSVLAQTWGDWELIVATRPGVGDRLGAIRLGAQRREAPDDRPPHPRPLSREGREENLAARSSPDSSDYLDPRIKVIQVPEDRSPAARLNQAARVATGERIAYLGAGEEFFPDYLERIAAVPAKIGVVVCGCDVMVPGANAAPAYISWSPVTIRSQLFAKSISSRFGIAHSRELWERAGGFNELCGGAEWDLLKRFARLGAEFVFPDFKAGKCRAVAAAAAGEERGVRSEERGEIGRGERVRGDGMAEGGD